jgi:DNA-binding response OmpR family regulator
MKILLAEDDKHISVIAKMILEQIGNHTVTHVDNGEDALNKALNEEFDVILLDEMMPKMSGLKVCEEYKNRSLKKTPIIFLSAKSQIEDIQLFNKMGSGYISKPFDPANFCQLLNNIINNIGTNQ